MDTTPLERRVAGHVAAALQLRGSDRRWLARETGIQLSTLARKLDGERPLSVSELHRIALALKVPTDSLLEG